MRDEQITPNFKLREFLASYTATRRGIDNTPDEQSLGNIREHLAPGMQRIRDVLGAPIVVASGYRSPALNTAVGGSRRSQHMLGLAADFTAPEFGTPREICAKLLQHQDTIDFDQLIFEGTWVHVSFTGKPRRSVLTAHFEGGKVRYTEGLTA